MAVFAERDRLQKERHLHEVQLHQKQLGYLLERCNSYATQATLVTGFAFTSFSAVRELHSPVSRQARRVSHRAVWALAPLAGCPQVPRLRAEPDPQLPVCGERRVDDGAVDLGRGRE